MKGKWAAGIEPRGFTWIYKGILAVSERPGRIDDGAPPGAPRRRAALAEASGIRARDLDPAGHAEHERLLRARTDREPLRAARRSPAARSARSLLRGRRTLHVARTRRCCCTATRSPIASSGSWRGISSGVRRSRPCPPRSPSSSGSSSDRSVPTVVRCSSTCPTCPRPPVSDVIELRELRVSAVVGVLSEERDRAQPLDL